MDENIEYEKLVQEIYQAILKSEGFENIKVEHNVNIEGKSGCKHQVDVYWEFKLAGELHRVAIECKNYSTEISIGIVRNFFGVINDVGNIKGIIVTKIGYQSGAKKFADYYGITLKEVRYPTDLDWEGRVKQINIKFKAYMIDIKKRNFIWDDEWNKSNASSKPGSQLSGSTEEIILIKANDEKINTLHELDNKLKNNFKPEQNLEQRFNFDDTFILFPSGGKLKINAIVYIYDVCEGQEELVILDGQQIAKAIIKDVKNGDITFIDKNGNIKK